MPASHYSTPAFRTADLARPTQGGARGILRPSRRRSWRDVAASVRGRANQTAFGLLIALVIVLVPLLDALRFAGEAVFHERD